MALYSRLSYDNIEISHTRTLQFVQEPVYSNDGVDRLYTHITITVQGLISEPLDLVSPIGNVKPAEFITALRERLLTPRKTLIYTDGTDELIHLPDDDSDADINNGPRPISFNIIRLDGDQCWIVQYSIECWIQECETTNTYVLSNRWSMTDRIDDSHLTTRTIEGRMVVRAVDTGNIDDFRSLVVPGMQPGFRRDAMQFTLQSDGLAMDYIIEDKEEYMTTPFPANMVEARFTTSVGLSGSALQSNEMYVKIKGEPQTCMKDLLQLAANYVSSRISLENNSEIQHVFMGGAVTEDMYNHTLELSVQTNSAADVKDEVTKLPLRSKIGIAPTFQNMARTQQDFQRRLAADPKLRGSGKMVQGFVARLNTPCGSNGSKGVKNPTIFGDNTNDDPVVIYGFTICDKLPDGENTRNSQSQSLSPYTHYELSSLDNTTSYTHMLPVAGFNLPPAIIQLAAATTERLVRWVVIRIGKKPDVPSAQILNDSEWVFVDEKIKGDSVELAPNQTDYKYRIEGEYRYVRKSVRRPGTGFTLSVPPTINASLFDSNATINTGDYVAGVIR